MIKIGVCDDEERIRVEVCNLIRNQWKYPDITVVPISPEELVARLDDSLLDFQIMVMDIQMDTYNGIVMTQQINKILPSCQVIYLTGYTDYVSDVYETDHCYYVLKQKMKDKLPAALHKAADQYLKKEGQFLSLRCNRRMITLPVSDILYIEREQRHCNIITESQRYSTNVALHKLLELLPSSFVRCHTGYIVNLHYVGELNRNYILIRGFLPTTAAKLPVGRYYWNLTKDRFLEFWGKHMT